MTDTFPKLHNILNAGLDPLFPYNERLLSTLVESGTNKVVILGSSFALKETTIVIYISWQNITLDWKWD